MGVLNFFFGLQVKQNAKGTIIHQQNTSRSCLKGLIFDIAKAIDTPIATATRLDINKHGLPVDEKRYKDMMGYLLYLTAIDNDTDYASYLVDRKITSGMDHFLALLTAKAEYVVVASSCAQLL
ncbi:uncharacterized protein [Nicotiana tomentosiformis]|uniref:uncharacterized protein n=1 Tax=Nicotiana tomentosiformis TaxID=4098 RepID=UPI00388C3716